jgi:hypothetical protein
VAAVWAIVVSSLSSQADEVIEVADIETDPVPDEYPIRHEWTFVIPPTPADLLAATKEEVDRWQYPPS